MNNIKLVLEKSHNDLNNVESHSFELRRTVNDMSLELDYMQHKLQERKYAKERLTTKLDETNRQIDAAEKKRLELIALKKKYNQINENNSQKINANNDVFIDAMQSSRILDLSNEKYKFEEAHLKRRRQVLCDKLAELHNKIQYNSTRKQILTHNIAAIKDEIHHISRNDIKEQTDNEKLSLQVDRLIHRLSIAKSYRQDKEFKLNQTKKEYHHICKLFDRVSQELKDFEINTCDISLNNSNEHSNNILLCNKTTSDEVNNEKLAHKLAESTQQPSYLPQL